jgi:hypothetical protein
VKNVAKVKGVRKGKPRKKRRPKTTPLETAKLRIAWVTLASKVVVFLGSIVGLAAAIVGLVTLLVRLQVGGDRPRPDDRHAPLQKLEVVEVADQPPDMLLAQLRRHFLPAGTVRVVDDEAPTCRQRAADGAHAALLVCDDLPLGEAQPVLCQRRRRRRELHASEDCERPEADQLLPLRRARADLRDRVRI